MLLPFSFTISCIAVIWGNDIMQLLYKNAGTYDGNVFAWVMAAFPAYCIMYTYSTLLTANGSISLMNKISLAGVIINLSLNFYIIPHEKALGAAISAFATQSTLALCYIYFCHKETTLPKNPKWIAAHLSFVVFVFAFGYLVHLSSLGWIMQVMLTGLAAVITMVALRFISTQGISLLFSKVEKQHKKGAH